MSYRDFKDTEVSIVSLENLSIFTTRLINELDKKYKNLVINWPGLYKRVPYTCIKLEKEYPKDSLKVSDKIAKSKVLYDIPDIDHGEIITIDPETGAYVIPENIEPDKPKNYATVYDDDKLEEGTVCLIDVVNDIPDIEYDEVVILDGEFYNRATKEYPADAYQVTGHNNFFGIDRDFQIICIDLVVKHIEDISISDRVRIKYDESYSTDKYITVIEDTNEEIASNEIILSRANKFIKDIEVGEYIMFDSEKIIPECIDFKNSNKRFATDIEINDWNLAADKILEITAEDIPYIEGDVIGATNVKEAIDMLFQYASNSVNELYYAVTGEQLNEVNFKKVIDAIAVINPVPVRFDLLSEYGDIIEVVCNSELVDTIYVTIDDSETEVEYNVTNYYFKIDCKVGETMKIRSANKIRGQYVELTYTRV